MGTKLRRSSATHYDLPAALGRTGVPPLPYHKRLPHQPLQQSNYNREKSHGGLLHSKVPVAFHRLEATCELRRIYDITQLVDSSPFIPVWQSKLQTLCYSVASSLLYPTAPSASSTLMYFTQSSYPSRNNIETSRFQHSIQVDDDF